MTRRCRATLPSAAPAAFLAALALALTSLAAPPAPAHPQPQSPTATTRPAARPPEPPTVTTAAKAPASQPVTAAAFHSEIGQSAIRRAPNTHDAAPSTSPSAVTQAAPGFDTPRVAGALAVVLGLIFALRWLLRRSVNPSGLPGPTNAVQVLTRSPLSPRQQLLLVRVGRRLLVVSDCNGQLNPLSEITDPDEVAALVGQLRDEKLATASRSFGNLLGMWRRGGNDIDADEAEVEQFPRATPDLPRPQRRGEEDEVEDDGSAGGEDADPSVASARSEINGLMERVRLISHQFKP